jgi:hypothetical protein
MALFDPFQAFEGKPPDAVEGVCLHGLTLRCDDVGMMVQAALAIALSEQDRVLFDVTETEAWAHDVCVFEWLASILRDARALGAGPRQLAAWTGWRAADVALVIESWPLED